MSEIIVGKKPLSHYQGYAYILIEHCENTDNLIIKGYGRNISKAMVLADWITREFKVYTIKQLKPSRSHNGYIGIEIEMVISKNA